MFWRTHFDGWRRGALNQREYCELHGLPLKRFGNWRAKLRHEEPAPSGERFYSRGGEHSHMSGHMTGKQIVAPPASHVPSARSTPPSGHRRFSEADKRRLVEEPGRPGASVSGVAREHGIAVPLLSRWKRELAPAAEATFLPVPLTDPPAPSALAEFPRSGLEPAPVVTPVVVERSTPGMAPSPGRRTVALGRPWRFIVRFEKLERRELVLFPETGRVTNALGDRAGHGQQPVIICARPSRAHARACASEQLVRARMG